MRPILGGLLLAVACASSAAGQAGTGPEAEQTQDLSQLVNALLGGVLAPIDGSTLQNAVAEAGQIPFKRDVPTAFLKRERLAAYLGEVFDAEYPEAQARLEARLLCAFDLLPAGTDLRSLRAKVLEENVAGFYDDRPGKRQLFAISEEEAFTPMNQLVLVHELRHALQDQYADLHAAVAGTRGDFDDRSLAALSLYEGDAMFVMERFLRMRLGAGVLPASDRSGDATDVNSGLAMPGLDVPGAPPVVRDQLVQPYLAGSALAREIWAQGGAAAMREAWSHPPESTEQVLHPALFLSRQPPRAVSVQNDGPAEGRLLSRGVLGEMLLRTLLGPGREDAATGWGGDEWRLWEVRGRTALRWRSEWDAVQDLSEFHQALVSRFAERHGPPRKRDGWSCFEDGGPRWFALRRTTEGGDAVELLSADDPLLFASLLASHPSSSGGKGLIHESETADHPLDIGVGTIRVHTAASDEGKPSSDPGQGGPMATSTPPGNQTNLGMAPNVAGLLCYVPCCIGLVFSVVAAIVEKQSRFVRFHAFQSLLLHAAAIVVGIALQVLNAILAVTGLGVVSLLVSLLGLVVGLGLLAVSVLLMIKANGGEEMELPVIGPMARQWV